MVLVEDGLEPFKLRTAAAAKAWAFCGYWLRMDLNLSSSGQRQLQKLELLQLLIEDGLEPFKLRTAAGAKA